jgi:ferredoxin-nitrite reductase
VDIEEIKRQGLEVDFQRYISLGSTNFLGLRVRNAFPIHTAITNADYVRLKWLGIFHNKIRPGRFMLRLRVVNGVLTADQLELIAELAKKFGNRWIDLTTRQGIQIRDFDFYYLPRILQDLEAAGLSTLQTGMDNFRNVTGCALAGIDPLEVVNASSVVRKLTLLFQGNLDYVNLPRKLNVSITGCRADCADSATSDIGLTPAMRYGAAGFNVKIGGALGSPPPRLATPLDVFIPEEDAPELCLRIAEIYRDHGFRERRGKTRLKFLLQAWGVEKFRAALEERMDRALDRAGEEPEPAPHPGNLLGIHPQKQEGMHYAGLLVPVGRLSTSQAMELARLAREYGSEELRLTPSQNIIIPHIPEESLRSLRREPVLEELTPNPSGIMAGLVACTGNDFCDFAVIESKTRALEIARFLEDKFPGLGLRLHVSGCRNSCGKHIIADIGLRGARVRIKGRLHEAAEVFLGMGPGKVAEGAGKVTWRDLPGYLEDLLRRYLKEGMEGESLGEFYKRLHG